MKKLYAQKAIEYGLLALVLIGLSLVNSGCSPADGTYFMSPLGNQVMGYATLPTGQTVMGMANASPNGWGYSWGWSTITNTVTATMRASSAGWRMVSFSQLPQSIQAAIENEVKIMAPAAGAAVGNSARFAVPVMGVFSLPAGFWEGVKSPAQDCVKAGQYTVCNGRGL